MKGEAREEKEGGSDCGSVIDPTSPNDNDDIIAFALNDDG